MSDRTVFASAFLVASLSLFGAFTIGQLFFFHFYEALIYVAIAIMVFYGENRYSYMLGIFVPGLSLLRGLIMGGTIFREIGDFLRLVFTLSAEHNAALYGGVYIFGIVLLVSSARAYRREVGKQGLKQTLMVSGGIAVAHFTVAIYWWVARISQGQTFF